VSSDVSTSMYALNGSGMLRLSLVFEYTSVPFRYTCSRVDPFVTIVQSSVEGPLFV
jgi:hypothetical protein